MSQRSSASAPGGARRPPTPAQPKRQTEGELEVVAIAQNHVVLAGEAKWTREPVGLSVLNHLRDVLRSVPGVTPDTQLSLFAREFEGHLRAEATHQNVRLVTPVDLYA